MKIENEVKVQQFKEEIAGMTAEDVMVRYRQVEATKKEIKERAEFADALLDAMESRLNDFLLETKQEGTITSNGSVQRVVKETFYVEDKPAFRDWATSTGNESLMSISVTQKAMKEFMDSQYQEHLKQKAEAEKQGVTLPPFEFQMPTGLNKKQEYKLSITKK